MTMYTHFRLKLKDIDDQTVKIVADAMALSYQHIEIVDENDPLAGRDLENVGKIKVLAWKGPKFIGNPFTDEAGVGWILAEKSDSSKRKVSRLDVKEWTDWDSNPGPIG